MAQMHSETLHFELKTLKPKHFPGSIWFKEILELKFEKTHPFISTSHLAPQKIFFE